MGLADSLRIKNFKLARLYQQSLKVLFAKTARNVGWVFGGNLANRGLGLLSFIILTRALGPEQYGILSIALSVLFMAIDLSDLGINASMIRFGAQFTSNKEWGKLSSLYSIALRSRLLIGGTVVGVGILVADPVSRLVFKRPELTPYLILAFGGVLGTLIYSALVSIFQAGQQFKKSVAVNLAYGATCLAGIVILLASGRLTSFNALIIYLVAPVVASAVAFFMLPRHLLNLRLWDSVIARAFFSFGIWMALWGVATVIQNYANIFILTMLTNPTEVGYFNAAFRIAMLAQMISVACCTVLNPKFSSLEDKPQQLRREFWKVLAVTLGMCGVIGLGVLLVPVALPLLTGDKYIHSIPVLKVLLSGMILFTLNLPFSSVIYARGKSQIFAFAACGGLVLSVLFNLWLIPKFGAVGPAIAFTIVHMFVLILCGSTSLVLLKQGTKSKFSHGTEIVKNELPPKM